MLLVPDRVVGSDQSGRYVLVANKDDVVEQRKVELGQQVGELRVIEKGINADDRVVISGLMSVVPGQKIEPVLKTVAVAGSGSRAMISKFFIERPVLANVIAILMVVIGVVSRVALPVAQYPNVVPPTVQVTTRYPGASARTVIDTVALPIEQQVNGVEDMLYMQSFAAADGSYSLTVTFDIGTDLNAAQVLVQNRVSAAMAALPQSVQVQGVIVQKKSTAILQIVTLTSPDGRFDSLYLSNYATIRLKDEIARLPGVGNVNVFGAGQYSMRIWLDPDKMQARGLDAQDVIQALQQQSEQVTAGQVGMPPAPGNQSFQYTIDVSSRFDDPEQFANVIVKTGAAGDLTRLRDIGRVELGAQTYGQFFNLDGKQAAGLAIFQSPGANALDVAHEVVRQDDRRLRKRISARRGLLHPLRHHDLRQPGDIDEVYKTLIEAAVLVLIVILVFLQDWRAMLVPATTVPVTIIGAFAAMAAHGLFGQPVDACSPSCSRSASSSTTPSSWSRAPPTTSRRACPATTRRSPR